VIQSSLSLVSFLVAKEALDNFLYGSFGTFHTTIMIITTPLLVMVVNTMANMMQPGRKSSRLPST